MKKFIAIFLVVCICLSCSACGVVDNVLDRDEPQNEINSANMGIMGILKGMKKEKPEEKYADLLEMLENEEYEEAILYIYGLSQSGNSFIIDGNDFIIETLPTGDASEAEPAEVSWTYDNIVSNLDDYAESGYFGYYDHMTGESYSDNEAFARAFEFLTNHIDHGEAKEYLSRFTVVEDVLLRKDESEFDHLGNVGEYEGIEEFVYDSYGRLIWANYDRADMRYDNWYDQFTYEYSSDGNLSATKIGWSDVDMLVIPVYENGVLAREEVNCADGEAFTVFYTYDEMGRLSSWIRVQEEKTFTNSYTYNDLGLVEEEVLFVTYYDSWYGEYVVQDSYFKSYTYGSTGNLVQMIETTQESYDNYNGYYWRSYTNLHEYNCDEQGRIVSENVAYGDYYFGSDGSTDPQSVVNSQIAYIYGNYYVFE